MEINISSITVGLGLTESLPDYNNIKPSLTVTADLDPGDDVDAILAALDAQVTAYCQAKVDDALEHAGQSPKYYDGPLYKIAFWQQRDAIVILPETVSLDALPGVWKRQTVKPMRFGSCHRWAQKLANDGEVLFYDHTAIHEIAEWWDNQTWYTLFGLRAWINAYDWEIKHLIIARYGLVPSENADKIRFILDVDDPSSLAEVQKYAEEHGVDYTVIEDQETLDTTIATWLAEHPRESHSEEDIRF